MLIHEDKSNEKAEKQYQEKRLSSWEDIPKSKEAYELDQLFDAKKDVKPPRHLAILGRAGIGKSTMCQYICYQWAQGKLWMGRFDALCWIPLRQLLQAKEVDSFADLVRQCCLLPADRKKISSDEISNWLKDNERTLFILDGYDEIESSLQENSDLKNIIAEFMQQPYWIITSRPHAAHGLQVDRKLENVGFSQSQVEEYITKALPEDSAKALLLEIYTTPWLAAIAHVPLNLELTCSCWKINPKTFTTMTDLYNDFTPHLLHYFLKRQQIPKYNSYTEQNFIEEYPSILEFLEHLAWEGLHQKSIVLSLQTDQLKAIYQHCCPNDPEEKDQFEQHALELGFLRASGSAVRFEDNVYEFAHLTFQEYFATRFIKKLFHHKPQEAEEIILSHKFNPQLQVVWWFLAGLLKNEPTHLSTFFSLLDDPPDLIGIYAFQLKVHCLEECGWPSTLPNIQKYKHELQNALPQLLRHKNKDKDVRDSVSDIINSAFKTSPEHAQQVIDALLPLFKDEDKAVRLFVVTVLGKAIIASPAHASQIIDALLPFLKNQDKAVCELVVRMLGEAPKTSLKPAPQIIETALLLLKDKDEAVRWSVVHILDQAIKTSPQHASQIIDAVLPLLQDEDEAILDSVVRILSQAINTSPEHAQPIINYILPLLKDGKAVRGTIAQMLGKAIGASPQHASQIIDAALPLLKDNDEVIRGSIAHTLGHTIEASPQHAPQIIDAALPLLQDAAAAVRRFVVYMLGEAIKASPQHVQSIIDAVLPLLQDDDEAVGRSVVHMLGKVIKTSPEYVQPIINYMLFLLKDGNAIRGSIAHMLGHTIEASPQHAPQIIDAALPFLKNDNAVRGTSAQMLGKAIGASPQHAPQIIDAALPLLKNDKAIRRFVVYMLGNAIKPSPEHAQQIIDAVLPLLKDEDKAVHLPVVHMLGEAIKASPQHAPQIIDVLLPLLKDEDKAVHLPVVNVLGEAIEASLSCQEIVLKRLSQLTGIEPNLVSTTLSYFDCKVILNFLCKRGSRKNLMVQLFVKLCFVRNISLHVKENNFVIYENGLHTIPFPANNTIINELKNCISSFYEEANGL